MVSPYLEREPAERDGMKDCPYCAGEGQIRSRWQESPCPQCYGEQQVPIDELEWPK